MKSCRVYGRTFCQLMTCSVVVFTTSLLFSGSARGQSPDDATLKDAWTAYNQYDTRDREQVRMLFERFIAEHPDSPLVPEANYRIGSLYSNNANLKRGETPDDETMKRYFTRAVEGYKAQYCTAADAARSFLALGPGSRAADGRAYYLWLRTLAERGTPDDLYPYREIGPIVDRGLPVELSPQERQAHFDHLKRNLFWPSVEAVERSMLNMRGPMRSEMLALLREMPKPTTAPTQPANPPIVAANPLEEMMAEVPSGAPATQSTAPVFPPVAGVTRPPAPTPTSSRRPALIVGGLAVTLAIIWLMRRSANRGI